MRNPFGFRQIFLPVLLLSWLCVSTGMGQPTFCMASASLEQEGRLLPDPWAGGLRAPQAYWLRLAGISDSVLLIYERSTRLPQTYRWKDNAIAAYEPAWQYLLPRVQTAFWLWADLNGDGLTDGIAHEQNNLRVYLAGAEAGQWQKAESVLLYQASSSLQPITVSGSDLPALADPDSDGDLDLLLFDPFGSGALYRYENQLTDKGELSFERDETPWGGIRECDCTYFSYNGQTCESKGNRIASQQRVMHAGGKSVLLFDADKNGSLDLLLGFEECNGLYVLLNEGSSSEPQFSAYQKNLPGGPAASYLYPAAYAAPGSSLFIAPYLPATPDPLQPEEFSWLLSQEGANWKLAQNNFVLNRQWDGGLESRPAQADFNADGRQDVLVAMRAPGANDGFSVHVRALENTGSAWEPAFSEVNTDWLNLSSAPFASLHLQFTDWNGNSASDLLLSGYNSESRQLEVWRIRQEDWKQPEASWETLPKERIELSLASIDQAWFYDLDADGRTDALVGRFDGSLRYYQQQQNGSFRLASDAFLGVGPDNFRRPLTATVGEFAGSEEPDLLLGDGTGRLRLMADFTLQSAFTDLQDISLNLSDSLVSLQTSRYNWPIVLRSWEGEKDALLIGNSAGGLQLYRNTDSSSPGSEGRLGIVYPNPLRALESLHLRSQKAGQWHLYDNLGRLYLQADFTKGASQIAIPSLLPGMYLIVLASEGKQETHRLLVLP